MQIPMSLKIYPIFVVAYTIYSTTIKDANIMWSTEVKETAAVSKEAIWDIWKNVEAWNVWDADVERSALSGKFEVNAKGYIKSKGAPKTTFTITECTPLQSFTNQTKLPLCTINFIHQMNMVSSGLEVTHRVEMRGKLSFLFARIIGRGLKKSLPNAVSTLIKQASNEK